MAKKNTSAPKAPKAKAPAKDPNLVKEGFDPKNRLVTITKIKEGFTVSKLDTAFVLSYATQEEAQAAFEEQLNSTQNQ